MCPSRATWDAPARVGDKVVVELREWETRHTNPEGEIIEVLGPPDAEGVDMLSVLRQYEPAAALSGTVLQEARGSGTVQTDAICGARGLPAAPGRHHRPR
jgi:exoribonuclease R